MNRLDEAFNSTPSALAANSRGRITSDQVTYVRERGQRELRRLGVALVLPIVGFIAFIVAAFAINANTVTGVVFIVGVCLFGLMIYTRGVALWRYRRNLRLDLETREAYEVCGRIKPQTYGGHDLFIERYRFGGLNALQRAVFDRSARYRLYFTPRTHIVLGAEELDNSEILKQTFALKMD